MQTYLVEGKKIYGTFIKDGAVRAGVEVDLYPHGNSNRLSYMVTGDDGKWEFSNLEAGFYDVYFYYGGADSSDHIYSIEIITGEAITARTNDISQMTFQVDEEVVEVGDKTISNAKISITNVDLIQGRISAVIVEHKLSSNSVWDSVLTIGVEWEGDDNTASIIVNNMDFDSDNPIEHDFRVYFQNPDGELAIQDSDESVIGGSAGYLQELNVEFNGYADLAEYPEVVDLVVSNASNIDGGTWSAPAKLPENGIARVSWKDMKTMGDVSNHPFANGSTGNVTVSQWKNLIGYKVFIYIGSTDAPSHLYPDPNEGNGDWFLIGKVKDNYLEVDCPKDKKFAFYACCILKLSGSSSTDPINELPYTEY